MDGVFYPKINTESTLNVRIIRADSLTYESFDISRRTSNMLEKTILFTKDLDYIVYKKIGQDNNIIVRL